MSLTDINPPLSLATGRSFVTDSDCGEFSHLLVSPQNWHTRTSYKDSTDNANVMCALHCKWVCRRWCNSGGVDATLLLLRLHRALQHCFTATILDHWLGLCAALLHPNPTGNVGKSHKNVNRPSSPRPSSHLLEQRLLQLGIAKMCFFFHICLTHKGFHPKNRHFK